MIGWFRSMPIMAAAWFCASSGDTPCKVRSWIRISTALPGMARITKKVMVVTSQMVNSALARRRSR